MNCALCEDGFETRIEPESGKPYALACRQCKPHLRFLQLNGPGELQDKISKRNARLKERDFDAK